MAKQAAEVDLLTEGRFRLGVGLGWNAVEYEALGKTFTDRGRRKSEQIELLRRLWTERSVTLDGQYETVTGAGLAPLPVQRPIPLWIGGSSPAAYRRAGRLADGWFPQVVPGPKLDEAGAIVDDAAVGPGATRRRSAWRAGSAGRAASTRSWTTSGAGGPPGPPTSPSTPWTRASARWTTTSRRWPEAAGALAPFGLGQRT